MSLTPLEQHIFAEYVSNGAASLNITDRAYPYGELLIVIEDKVLFDVRPFGLKSSEALKTVAKAFIDLMVEREGFTTIKSSLGGWPSHRLDVAVYRAVLADLQASNPIIQEAQKVGPSFWQGAFDRLTA